MDLTLENKRKALIRKRNDKSARIVALIGSVSAPLAFAGAFGRALAKVEVDEKISKIELLQPLFGTVGTFCLFLSVVSLCFSLFFYIRYDMLIPCLKHYLTTTAKAFAVGLGFFVVGAVFTGGIVAVYYGLALVLFPIIFVSKYYKRIDEDLLKIEKQMGISELNSSVVTVRNAANQEYNKWEALFAPIRDEPVPGFPYILPFEDATKGWIAEWSATITEKHEQFEIQDKTPTTWYLEISERDGKVSDVKAKVMGYKDADSTFGFKNINPIDGMQFIQLSPFVAVIIGKNKQYFSAKKIHKLIKAFPNAPDSVDRNAFDMESAVLETEFLRRLNESGLSTEEQVSLLGEYRAYREKFWLFVLTKHYGAKEDADAMRDNIEKALLREA